MTRNEGNDTRYQEYIDGYTQRQYEGVSNISDVFEPETCYPPTVTACYWRGRGWHYLTGCNSDGEMTIIKNRTYRTLGHWDGCVQIATPESIQWMHATDVKLQRRARDFDPVAIADAFIDMVIASKREGRTTKFWALAEILHRLQYAETAIEAEAMLMLMLQDETLSTLQFAYRDRQQRGAHAARANRYIYTGAK